MAEELYKQQKERARSRSIRRAKSIKNSQKRLMTPLEKHNLLTSTVNKLGHDMTVFHLRWVPGDYLDDDILNSVPIFWFKKFGWRPEDIKVLYAVGEILMTAGTAAEIQKVYGKKKKKKSKRHILLQNQDPQSPTASDVEAVFMRTKRLKKQNVSQKNVFSMSRKSSASISKSMSISEHGNDPISLKSQGSYDTNDHIGVSGDRERADTSDLKLPRATHSFSHHHRRQSSMSSRRPSLVESGEYIWSRLASNRGDSLNRRQFDIELQNNNILADPDMCASLFDLLRDNKKDMKTIDKIDFLRVYPLLDNIPLKDEIEDPQSLQESEKIMIVLKQVLYHVMSQTPFDVNDYLTPKLRAKDLSDPQKVITALGSRDSDWRIRLQIMEWITANMEEETTLFNTEQLTLSENIGPFLLGWMTQCLDERSNLSKAALYMFPEIFGITLTRNLEAFGYLNDIMKSLFCVLRNKRSEQLAAIGDQTVIEVIEMIMEWHHNHQLDNEILLEMCEIFRDNTSMKEQKHGKVRERCCAYFGYILYGLDTSGDSKKNSTSSNLVDNGNGSIVVNMTPQSPVNLNVISEIPAKLNVADKNTDDSKTSDQNSGNSNGNAANAEEDEKEKDRSQIIQTSNNTEERKVKIKISKTMRHAYLLEQNPQFIEYMAASLEKATADKEEHVRNVAFKLMVKLEKTDVTILTDMMFKSDPYTMKRFDKYKSRKGGKKKTPRARGSTISAVKQARQKAMLLKRKSTPQGHGHGAKLKSMPVVATIETTLD